MGAFSVVLQTLFSGKTELPFGTFVLLMQPIHLAIGIGEGLVTAAVIAFVWKARPEILEKSAAGEAFGSISMKKVLISLLIAVVFVGSVLSWFASANPDGLEWSMEKTAGTTELETPDGVHKTLSQIQEKLAFLPDYGFKSSEAEASKSENKEEAWPSVSAGTSVSGIVGGAFTLVLAAFIGVIISAFKKKKKNITT